MVWGTDNWAEGSQDMIHGLEHLIENSLTIDDPFAFDWPMNTSNTLDLDSSVSNEPDILVSNTLETSSDASREELSDGSGYSYVFPKPTENSDERLDPNWSEEDEDTETWTSLSVSTTWSE